MKFGYVFSAFALLFSMAASASPSVESPSASGLDRPAVLTAELKVRYGIVDRVKALLDARDFRALNALELQYRSTRARTPSGVWKLSKFHGAVHAALPEADAASGCAFSAQPVLKAWAAATPAAPTPYIAMATMLVGRAWCFRGDGRSGEVADEAWKPFRENIAAAHHILQTHKDIAAIDPEFYVVMEDVYRAEGRSRPEFRKLLDEASAREPYYYQLYAHAYFYNMPQWSGGIAEIDEVARYAVERTRKQDGSSGYARYYWSAMAGDCLCWAQAMNLPMMKQAMNDLAKRYPDPWNLANLAKIACTLHDAGAAKDYFDALREDDGSEAWADDARSWQQCRTFAGFPPKTVAAANPSPPAGN